MQIGVSFMLVIEVPFRACGGVGVTYRVCERTDGLKQVHVNCFFKILHNTIANLGYTESCSMLSIISGWVTIQCNSHLALMLLGRILILMPESDPLLPLTVNPTYS